MNPAYHTSITVDFVFQGEKPTIEDLHMIRGRALPGRPASGKFAFNKLAHLGFDQIDDFYGIKRLEEEGDDVAIWLFPVISGKPVYNHPGPYNALRLEYSVLRNPMTRAKLFLNAVVEMDSKLNANLVYEAETYSLDEGLARMRMHIDIIVAYWKEKGVVVGTYSALQVPR